MPPDNPVCILYKFQLIGTLVGKKTRKNILKFRTMGDGVYDAYWELYL